ncbi:MAG: hypothetical protein ACPG7F_18980 [Aggregatilineales bacterium]
MQATKPGALFKPTLSTRFHIDYAWWEEHESSGLRSYILTHLPPEKREYFVQNEENRVVDFIDADTGEVRRLDELGQAIQEAATDPDFFNMQTSLVDCIFRVFLSNNNQPLTPGELAEISGRDARTILKTFSGMRVYKGVRPLPDA